MRSPLLPRILLIFTLMFVQMGSLTHGISHILAEKYHGSEQSLPHDKFCDQCAAYAQIGGTIGSSCFSFSSGENCEAFILNHFTSHPAGTFAAFAARAPPHSS